MGKRVRWPLVRECWDYPCTDGSADRRHPLRVGIEAKDEQKTIEALRRYLARVRENRVAAAALAVTTRFSEPLAIYDKCHVVVSVPEFGQPGADHAFYEKLVINGLIIAQMLAQVAAQAPLVESVDLEQLQQIVDRVAATATLRRKIKTEISRTISAANDTRTATMELDDALNRETKELYGFVAAEYEKLRAGSAALTLPIASAARPALSTGSSKTKAALRSQRHKAK